MDSVDSGLQRHCHCGHGTDALLTLATRFGSWTCDGLRMPLRTTEYPVDVYVFEDTVHLNGNEDSDSSNDDLVSVILDLDAYEVNNYEDTVNSNDNQDPVSLNGYFYNCPSIDGAAGHVDVVKYEFGVLIPGRQDGGSMPSSAVA